jgi:hypothetical protein
LAGKPYISQHSLHESTNENGLRLVDFSAGRQMAIKRTYFMNKRIKKLYLEPNSMEEEFKEEQNPGGRKR